MNEPTTLNPGVRDPSKFTSDFRGRTPKRGPAGYVVAAAQRAMTLPQSQWTYRRVRPFTVNMFAGNHITSDCSGFAISCYYTAGLPDPSGSNFTGYGNTDTLQQHGTLVDGPDPGILAFWSNPDHVAVCLNGGGDIIEFGGSPAPIRATVGIENHYHASFSGFRRYVHAGEIGHGGGGGISPGTIPLPSIADVDWSPYVRFSWAAWAFHGERADNNSKYAEWFASLITYCTSKGPR